MTDATHPVVLVVDDSPTIRAVIKQSLSGLPVEVVTASSGIVALSEMNSRAPRLILLDVMLPKLNGYQICQAIRRNPQHKQTPVVMLSGKDGMFDKVRGKLVGATEYLTKPFEPGTLVALVRKHLALEGER